MCLLLAVSAMVYFILFWTGEINDANLIRDMRIENNELIIDVDTPWYYGKRLWYIDLDETKTIANVTIKYNFGKSRAGNDELRAPVNSDKDEPFTRETMQSLKEIRVVTSSGKVVKTLVITNSMRENFRDDR